MPEVIFDSAKHEYSDDLGTVYQSVTQVLRKSGKYHFAPGSEEKMQLGTNVHWMIQLLEQQALNPRRLPIKYRGYRKAWMNWKKASGFEVKAVEQPFIDFTYGYAGTIDLFGMIAKSLAVVDLKTGVAIPPSTRLQTVAYAHHKVMWPCRRIALRLISDGTYRVKEYPVEQYGVDWAEFMNCLRRTTCR